MPSTARIGPEIITFLRQLKKNNNREWFQKNKDRYDPTRPPHPGGPTQRPSQPGGPALPPSPPGGPTRGHPAARRSPRPTQGRVMVGQSSPKGRAVARAPKSLVRFCI